MLEPRALTMTCLAMIHRAGCLALSIMFQLRIVQNVHSVGTGKIGQAALLALSDAIVASLRMAYGRGRMLQYKTRNPVRAAAVDASE